MEEYNIEKAYVGDFIGIRGTVKIENGEHIAIGRNHWVSQGLELIGAYLLGGSFYYSTGYIYGASYNFNIYIGSDTSTPTTVSMASLAAPIGTQPGTAPNTKSLSGVYYSSSTTPVVLTWSATWNAGTVSGTLGETGLYLYDWFYTVGDRPLTSEAYSNNPFLASRLSVADGSFTAFTINTAAALTVTWTVNLVYA
jgi:hypothetical protein